MFIESRQQTQHSLAKRKLMGMVDPSKLLKTESTNFAEEKSSQLCKSSNLQSSQLIRKKSQALIKDLNRKLNSSCSSFQSINKDQQILQKKQFQIGSEIFNKINQRHQLRNRERQRA